MGESSGPTASAGAGIHWIAQRPSIEAPEGGMVARTRRGRRRSRRQSNAANTERRHKPTAPLSERDSWSETKGRSAQTRLRGVLALVSDACPNRCFRITKRAVSRAPPPSSSAHQ